MRGSLLALLLLTPGVVAAQDLGGYLTVGVGPTDYVVNRESIGQVSGGVLLRLADDRIRVGVQGCAFHAS